MDPFRRLFGHSFAQGSAGGAVDLAMEEEEEKQLPAAESERFESSLAERRWDPSGSLRSVFSSAAASSFASPNLDAVADVDLPSVPSLHLSASASRRSRLDESAGEGLRRSVLVRNAMLTSMERERKLSESLSLSPLALSKVDDVPMEDVQEQRTSSYVASVFDHRRQEDPVPTHEHIEREVQWFEDLLSELGSDEEFEDDFVSINIDQDIEMPLHSSDDLAESHGRANDAAAESPLTAAAVITTADSGFAERRSVSSSASSSRLLYPHVCPYPSVGLAGSSSSEELPALVQDDSDAEDDDDDTPLAEPDQDPLHEALLSRPLSPVTGQAESMCVAELFSPPSTRPTSPTASSSSKSDTDQQPTTLGGCAELPSLDALSELTLCGPAERRYEYRTESLDLAVAHLFRPSVRRPCNITVMPSLHLPSTALGLSLDVAAANRRSQSADTDRVRWWSDAATSLQAGKSDVGPHLSSIEGICQVPAVCRSSAARSSASASPEYADTIATRMGQGIVTHWRPAQEASPSS